MRIVAKLNTTDNNGNGVKMFTDYDLEIKIATSVQVNVPISSN
tara:strand:- start:915 stop:1043 length:129 start_codon:yes stop_codon:yes gene_type:complete